MPDQLQQPGKAAATDRPFPWRCPKCLNKSVNPETMPYVAKASHDGRLYELAIPEVQIPKCSVCGELVFSNGVDEKITDALRTLLLLLTPAQIREARLRLGLSPKELAERLGTTEETFSRWEEGTVLQSRTMDNLLRVFFAVPEVRLMLTGASQDPGLGLYVNPSGR